MLTNVHWRIYDWLADFLFTKRYQTHKWVGKFSGPKITDKSMSHASRLQLALVGALLAAVFGGYWLRAYQVLTSSARKVDVFVLGMISVVVAPMSLIIAFAVLKGLRGYIRKRSCERCDEWTRYYHDVTRAIPDTSPTKSEKHYFCSIDCREAWECEHVEYERDSYYSVQTERDVRRRNERAIAELEADS